MHDAGDVRTTLDLDDDVLPAVKELAELRDTTAAKIVSDLVRKALQARRSSARRVRNGVPLLRRASGAPIMTMALVNELRDDE